MSSIFSEIVRGEIPSYRIAEDEHFFAFLDINPLAKGHTLIIPKKEVDYFFDLDNELLSEVNLFAKKVAFGIKEATKCNRVGVMIVGLDVPHAHVHLIPINKASDMSLSNPKVKMIREEFEEIAKAIRENINI